MPAASAARDRVACRRPRPRPGRVRAPPHEHHAGVRACCAATSGKPPVVTRVGLVLGAGGLTGYAFPRGVLRALQERGSAARRADVIVGTSAGSMVGAFLRKPDA